MVTPPPLPSPSPSPVPPPLPSPLPLPPPPLSKSKPAPGDDRSQMAVLEAQIRASISNANTMFAATPIAADDGAMNGSSVPKKAQDHTLR